MFIIDYGKYMSETYLGPSQTAAMEVFTTFDKKCFYRCLTKS